MSTLFHPIVVGHCREESTHAAHPHTNRNKSNDPWFWCDGERPPTPSEREANISLSVSTVNGVGSINARCERCGQCKSYTLGSGKVLIPINNWTRDHECVKK